MAGAEPDLIPTLVPLSPRQAQGVVKDLDADLLQHLAQGTAFLQVSTKAHPNGEMRGRVGPHRGRAPCPLPLLPVAGWHCLEQGGRAQDHSVTRS